MAKERQLHASRGYELWAMGFAQRAVRRQIQKKRPEGRSWTVELCTFWPLQVSVTKPAGRKLIANG